MIKPDLRQKKVALTADQQHDATPTMLAMPATAGCWEASAMEQSRIPKSIAVDCQDTAVSHLLPKYTGMVLQW